VVRPTDPALVITAGGPRLLRFGLPSRWNKRPLINARAETVQQKFASLLKQRCLIPASAWIEWQDYGAPRKRLWRLRPSHTIPFALAGLYADEAFLVLTCQAADEIAFIHDRMPVVLAPKWEQVWLAGDAAIADILPALVPLCEPITAFRDDDGGPAVVAQPDLFD
jgi:putative SOS response-associated peptidase YedK